MKLSELGWTKYFQKQLSSADENVIAGRVMREDLQGYQLMTDIGHKFAILPGRMRREGIEKSALPTVGDWVLARSLDNEPEKVAITRLLDRRTKFSRREPGTHLNEQIIAANIDTVFIVCGLDGNFNPGRIERYLLLTYDSGATPVIVLSKSDLTDRLSEQMEEVRKVAIGVSIHAVSAVAEEGMTILTAYLEPGKTIAMLGSSGVGKSTIINTLLGEAHFDVGDVREADSKGRHTTTHRELVVLPDGGLVMDTPGMREIQLWSEESALASSFDDIQVLAEQCKFSDCSHTTEPGCAVLEEIDAGKMDQDRIDSYHKLERELQRLAAQQDAQARIKRKTQVRQFSRMIRKRPTKRDY